MLSVDGIGGEGMRRDKDISVVECEVCHEVVDKVNLSVEDYITDVPFE